MYKLPSCSVSGQRMRSVRLAASAQKEESRVYVNVQGRNIKITDAIKDYVTKKIYNSVNAFEGKVTSVNVRLSAQGGGYKGTKGPPRQRTEITAYTKGKGIVRAEDIEDSLYSSIDLVTDKLHRKLMRVKERYQQRGRFAAVKNKYAPTDFSVTSVDEDDSGLASEVRADDITPEDLDKMGPADIPDDVTKVKYFYLDTMSISDAIERMSDLSLQFFAFKDVANNDIKIVYDRGEEDGYGVIVPVERNTS